MRVCPCKYAYWNIILSKNYVNTRNNPPSLYGRESEIKHNVKFGYGILLQQEYAKFVFNIFKRIVSMFNQCKKIMFSPFLPKMVLNYIITIPRYFLLEVKMRLFCNNNENCVSTQQHHAIFTVHIYHNIVMKISYKITNILL